MKILVTGGLGFIGSNLTAKLLKGGHKVIILDDLSTGRMENLRWIKEECNPGPNLRVHNVDITKFFDFDYKTVDQIYHLACPASPPKYYQDPLKTLDINYIGTKNILELAREYKARILFSSTSEIYGDPKTSPQKESYTGNVNPVSPRSVYDEGKRVAETLVSEYHRQYGIETKIARIFNTFGPRMDPDDGRVVTNFVKQFLKGEPFTIYGDGKQTRSFCYIDDLVEGLTLLMNSDKYINEPVNVGSPGEITMIDLACHISRSWTPKLEFRLIPVSDPKTRCPDIKKMNAIGWNPVRGFERSVEDDSTITIVHQLNKMKEYMKKEMGL